MDNHLPINFEYYTISWKNKPDKKLQDLVDKTLKKYTLEYDYYCNRTNNIMFTNIYSNTNIVEKILDNDTKIKFTESSEIMSCIHNKTGKILKVYNKVSPISYLILLDEPVNNNGYVINEIVSNTIYFTVIDELEIKIQEKCVCQIIDLMARGCKCGYIEIERSKNLL